MENKLVSFDIFDTLITRTVAEPKTIFRIMQEILCINEKYFDISRTLRSNFSIIRINAEQFVSENSRINRNKKQISFDDIYEFLQINYALSDIQTNKLKELELITEKNCIVPIKANIDMLKQYKDNGNTVILISDMYLSSEQIREFLIPFDDIFRNIKIYVSNEHEATKRNGKLYKIVKQDYSDFKEWLHVGDNFLADILQARLNGIKTKRVKLPKLLPHEKYLLKECKDNINGQTKLKFLDTKLKYFNFAIS